MLFSSLPVCCSNFPFAVATSCSSDPYLKVRPESECTTEVYCGSCCCSASNKADRCREAMEGAKEANSRRRPIQETTRNLQRECNCGRRQDEKSCMVVSRDHHCGGEMGIIPLVQWRKELGHHFLRDVGNCFSFPASMLGVEKGTQGMVERVGNTIRSLSCRYR